MNRNVEIKAKVKALATVRKRAENLADGKPIVLDQEDTFFLCPQGRLKLRKTPGKPAELIYYERPDDAGPKESQYAICRLSDAVGLEAVLGRAYGIRGVVRKSRTLYMVGRTRLHLDAVDGLGAFLELEVVLGPAESVSEGVAEAYDLMDKLGVARTELVEGAYIDLLEERHR